LTTNTRDKMMFTVAEVKPPIDLADLNKIDIRVGTILTVEDVDGSDKLVKLTVTFGNHQGPFSPV